ncbi:MAG: hypothetical protein LC750_00600 [Actinobacteria bacterium]|nr:hypothetical protein [Actinomycetota bacterium]
MDKLLIMVGAVLVLAGVGWGRRVAVDLPGISFGKYVDPLAVGLTVTRSGGLDLQAGWDAVRGFHYFQRGT